MVSFIENEKGARAKLPEHVSQPRNVDFVGEKAMRGKETRVMPKRAFTPASSFCASTSAAT